MVLVIIFIIGMAAAFIGLIPPGMLNMTAVKISMTKDKTKAKIYALGVSFTVFFQATLALLITRFLRENQQFLIYVKELAAVIFILLSFYFLRKGFSERKENYTAKQRIKNNFIIGMLLSFFNMFAIPYYYGVGAALGIYSDLMSGKLTILLFVTGAALGTFLLLYLYIYMAQRISRKIQVITKNINFILGILTGILGIVTLVNLQ